MELKGADVLAVEEVGAVGLAGVLLGVDVGEAEGAGDAEPGELNKLVASSPIPADLYLDRSQD